MAAPVRRIFNLKYSNEADTAQVLNQHHPPSSDIEAEYDRLRDLARNEASHRSAAFSKSHDAYARGDGAGAKHFSEEGKRHGVQMEAFNRQASELIFRENNAPGRVADNEIDLHGQFVEEAEDILEQRIRAGQQRGESVLHVIVGKGNHSVNHIQKIKPRVEQVCREQGLQFGTEENEGRMWVNLGGQPQGQPFAGGQHSYPHAWHAPGQHGGQHGGQQQHHGGPQQHHGGQQSNQNEEMEKLAKKFLPKLLKQLEKHCCVVM